MDTINKRLLLNYLYMAKNDLTISELSNFIESKTEGRFAITKVDKLKTIDVDATQ